MIAELEYKCLLEGVVEGEALSAAKCLFVAVVAERH
jgi:hypothetical protein